MKEKRTKHRYSSMKNLEKEVFSEARKSELVARGLSVDSVAGIIAAQKAILSREAAEESKYQAEINNSKSQENYWCVRANMLARIAKQNGAGYLLRSNREGVLHDDRPR